MNISFMPDVMGGIPCEESFTDGFRRILRDVFASFYSLWIDSEGE